MLKNITRKPHQPLPIPAPADDDLMVFTLSKLTGHAGSRFGWAVVKDETVFNRMTTHIRLKSMGVSRYTQLRAFKLLKTALKGQGRELFDFGYQTMKTRWERLSSTISLSKRFSLQQINPQYRTFYNKFREFSPANYLFIQLFIFVVLGGNGCLSRESIHYYVPKKMRVLALSKKIYDFDNFMKMGAYAWVKCEREEDRNCYALLQAAKITGQEGNAFGAEDRYVRLSLVRSQE